MAKVIHSMIRVRDLDASMKFYDAAFGLTVGRPVRLRRLHAGLSAQSRERFRDRADLEPRPRRALHAWRRLRPCRRRGAGSRQRASALHRARPQAQPDQGIPARRRADGQVLLRPGSRRLQDRGSAAARPLSLTRTIDRDTRGANEWRKRHVEDDDGSPRLPGGDVGRRRDRGGGGRQPGDRRQRRLGDDDQGADRRRGGDAGADGARDLSARPCWTMRSTARWSTALDEKAAADPALLRSLQEGVATLDRAKQFDTLDDEAARIAGAEGRSRPRAPFQTVRGECVTGIYNNPEVWQVFGYEGARRSRAATSTAASATSTGCRTPEGGSQSWPQNLN